MLRHGLAALAAIALLAGGGLAQNGKPKLPDDFKLNMMIRSMVVAVNQANMTNNYTVLRGLGSPRFKEANSAQRLGEVFEALRKSKFDLSPVLFFTPQMLAPPAITEAGLLRLTGYFDTVPQRVSFDMLFEPVEGEWMLYGINIATERSPAAKDKSKAADAPVP